MPVNMLVDTGARMLAINERIQEQLQIPVVEKRKAELANGHIVAYDVVLPVEVLFRNRRCNCSVMVRPGSSEPLLGVKASAQKEVLNRGLNTFIKNLLFILKKTG